jgi:mannose-6-phosphate isomerase-like protein (cupin superfamily)
MADSRTTPFDLSQVVIGLLRDGSARVVPQAPGPPTRVEGFTVGAPRMTRDAPHAGEMHPDGDELLFLISGRIRVALEEPAGERIVELRPGESLVVPRGTWHRVMLQEPSQLLHITPGPGGAHRPLRSTPQRVE